MFFSRVNECIHLKLVNACVQKIDIELSNLLNNEYYCQQIWKNDIDMTTTKDNLEFGKSDNRYVFHT